MLPDSQGLGSLKEQETKNKDLKDDKLARIKISMVCWDNSAS